MQRFWKCVLASAIAFSWAGTAAATSASTAISLIWKDTGTNMLFVDPLDPPEQQYVLWVVLDAGDLGVSHLDFSLIFDVDGANELNFVGGSEIAADPLTPGMPGYMLIHESPDGNEGIVAGIDLWGKEPLIATTATIGSVIFTVNPLNVSMDGPDVRPVFAVEPDWHNRILDGKYRDITHKVDLIGAEVKVPEPTTTALIVAGLGLMTLAGRRRDPVARVSALGRGAPRPDSRP